MFSDNVSDTATEYITPDSLEGRSYVVVYQCSDCSLVFNNEASQKKHSCPVKKTRLSISEERTVVKVETPSSSPSSSDVLVKPFEIVECTIVNVPEDNFVCSKCEETFEELNSFNGHTCVRQIEKSKEDKRLPPSESLDILEYHSEKTSDPFFRCVLCKVWFENLLDFEKHPCINLKLKPLDESAGKSIAENLQEDQSIKLEKLELSSSNEDLTSEPVSDSLVTPKIESEPVNNGLSQTPLSRQKSKPVNNGLSQTPLTRQERKKNQTTTPWQCSVCNKYFRARYYLTHHSCVPPSSNPLPRGALGKPPYQCQKCGVSFKYKTSFCRHIHHHCNENQRPKKVVPPPPPVKPRTPKTPEPGPLKPYQCHVCDKSFAKKYYLIHHSCKAPATNPLPRGSLGKPPYHCEGCGVVYKHKSSYCRHIHHECGKGRKFFKVFSGKYVGKGKKKSEPKTSNVCLLCNEDFRDKSSLESHVQSDHLSL